MNTNNTSSKLQNYIQSNNLDISIIDIRSMWVFSRVDAEFYQKIYSKAHNFLEEKKAKNLWTISLITDWEHWSPDLDPEGYIYISWTNIRTGSLIIDENTKKITEAQYMKNQRVLLEKWNVLLSIVWTVGNSAVITENIEGITDRNVATIKLLNSEYNPVFLSLFLNSKYWKLQTERFCTGNIQPLLNLTQVRSIKTPKPSGNFQEKIAKTIQKSHIERELSKKLYTEAEDILLKELDLKDWKPSEINISEKMSEEVDLFGRFDAEFFQPKYDELFSKLSKFKTDELWDIVDYSKWIEPWSKEYIDEWIPFARVSDFSINWFDNIWKKVSHDLFEKYGDDYSPKKDEILFTKDGTIGITSVVNKDMDIILSWAFLRLQKTIKIKSEYLALVLNSIVSKLQIERFSGWAIIAHLKPSDAMKIIIPILSDPIQKEISEKIEASHLARKLSEKLLENAKRAVEVYIEKDEDAGLKILNI